MKKKQIITYSAIGVGALLLLAATGMLVRSILQFRELEQAFTRERSRLTQFYRADVFPSAENVARERENREQLDGWFEELIRELGRESISRDDRSPSQFINRLERTHSGLRQQAERSRIRLPEAGGDFAFGFERYAGTGLLPSPDDVPRLTEQLIIITRLARLMYDSEISALRMIRRDVFEETTQEVRETPTPARALGRTAPAAGRQRSDARQPAATAQGAGVITADDMFATYRFVLAFDAREEALARFLNELASSPMYTVVRTVRLRKEVPPMVATRAAATGAGAADQDRRTARGGAAGADGLSFLFGGGDSVQPDSGAVVEGAGDTGAAQLSTSRPVSGIEMETPMSVQLEVDVYKFRSLDETRD